MRIRISLAILILLSMVLFIGCPKKTTPPPLPPAIEDETVKVTEPEITEPIEKSKEPEKRFELRTVFFDYDQFELTGHAKATLTDNAKQLLDNQKVNVLLEGYCDERGTEQYNLSLGQKRANTVKSFLTNYGISESRISTISYGEEKPVCRDASEGCWEKNRKVEFIVK